MGERAPSVSGAIWYTGTAKVHTKAGVVVHHVQYSSIAAWIDTSLVRRFKFLAGGARLNLSAEVTPELTDVLKWKRLERGGQARSDQAMSQENVEIVRLAYDRLNAGDLDGFIEFCAPEPRVS